MLWTMIGAGAACLTMLSFVPQIIKVLRNKCARDISIITLYQFSAGSLLWTIYGIHLKDAIIIAANIITLASLFVLIGMYYYYNKKRG